ncbi:MAG: ABC transporter ATP-binding protein [Thermocladium sp.]|jgi:energy-coupling factor transport system ATP-binding protein
MGVTVSDLWFRYSGSDKWALRGINLIINPGEVALLIGRSGAGKSTLIKAIAGLLRDRGESRGKIVTSKVYPVLQNPENQLIELTVRDELEGVAPWITRLLGLDQLMDRRIFELSGGEQQRVVLARAMMSDADVFLLDEPTMWLDIDSISRLLEIIWMIRLRGKTLIISEHRYHYFLPITDKVLLMVDGSIELQGAPRDVLSSSELHRIVGVPSFMEIWEAMGGRAILTVSEIASN